MSEKKPSLFLINNYKAWFNACCNEKFKELSKDLTPKERHESWAHFKILKVMDLIDFDKNTPKEYDADFEKKLEDTLIQHGWEWREEFLYNDFSLEDSDEDFYEEFWDGSEQPE